MLNVIGFIRVSTEEQADENRAGLQRQREDIRVACSQFGLKQVRTIELTNVSGTSTGESPEFQSMIESLRQPDIDGIVVSALDRLARPDTLGGLAVFDPFMKYKKKIWTPGQMFDVCEDSGFLISGILGLTAGLERKQILKRIQTAKEEQRKRGRCANAKITLPKGVDFDFKTGKWSYTEPWASKIIKAFELLVGGYSVRHIANELGGITDRGLAQILRNQIWIGVRFIDKRRGEKYPSRNGRQVDRRKVLRAEPLSNVVFQEGLISRDVWERAQRILSQCAEKWNNKRGSPSRFLVRGIAFCKCGERIYTRGDLRKGKHDIYFCRSRHPKGKGCGAPVLHRDAFDPLVIELLSEHLSKEEVLRTIVRSAVDGQNQPAHTADPSSLERELKKLDEQRVRILDLAVVGTLSREETRTRLEKIARDKRTITDQLNKAVTTSVQSVPTIVNHLITLLCEFHLLGIPEQSVVLQSLVSGIVLSQRGVEQITFKLPGEVGSTRTHTDTDSSQRLT